jgi:hypothetical protein
MGIPEKSTLNIATSLPSLDWLHMGAVRTGTDLGYLAAQELGAAGAVYFCHPIQLELLVSSRLPGS